MDLIPDTWYAVLDPAEVPRGRPLGRRVFGEDVVFWRDADGTIQAAVDRCPHRKAALSLGQVHADGIACPFHGFRFDGEGACVAIPAHPDMKIPPTMRLARRHVQEVHELLWMWSGQGEPTHADIPFYDTSGHRWDGSQVFKNWPVHYTRAMENQLDWSHLAFVHASTIGRFAPTVIDLEVDTQPPHFRSWLKDEPDNGHLHIIAPNVWKLRLSDRMFNFLAFVPVDEHEVRFIIRTYQRMVTVPGLSWLVGRLNALVNPIVLRQDERVVVSQRPRKSALTNGEIYVPSDKPIIDFLRWRAKARRPAEAPEPAEKTASA